ncbi:alkaline phosphatase-like [Lycorma delicatula]|uniref:alkaline phosphatase-like n=1 Tax=Lycorma delicatula TaxID=130591 RepID=UPI003F5131F0
MRVGVSLFLLLAGVAVEVAYGGLSKYRYTVETAKDLPAKEEYDAKYWDKNAFKSLNERLDNYLVTNKAKNLILFLGDGMSIPTITAARIYLGQLDQRAGENAKLSFENFPYTGLSKTYCVDKQVADSACTSTAYLGGVKANYGTLGVRATVTRGNCSLSNDPENHVHSILMWAQEAGKGTGLVTTANITDASPAGGYSHSADRYWQSDRDVVEQNLDPKYCPDIAQQLIRNKPGLDVKVIMGGGRKKFLPTNNKPDSPLGPGERLDGVNLIEEWVQEKKGRNKTAKFVYNRKGLLAKNITSSDFIFGLFQTSDMLYHLEEEANEQPTLEEMTRVAIERLQKEPNGYYLFVEGALIDKAHHKNMAHRALDETVEFSKAIELAVKLTNEEDTLIVVTADHAHTLSMSGYPERGSDILGVTENENKIYTTLAYMNGPSANLYKDIETHDFRKDDFSSDKYVYPSLITLEDETHGGDDVAVYARGPWSHLFTGSLEQHVIPHIMAFAAKIGPGALMDLENENSNSATSLNMSFLTSLRIYLFVTIGLMIIKKL